MPNENPNHNTSNSQRSRVLRHLQAGNSLTSMQALNHFGCARLAARIGELIDAGWPIQSRDLRVTNRDGKLVTVSEYRLAEGKGVAA